MEKETVTIDKFTDPSQWMVWKFQVKVNLLALGLYGLVDGSKVKPVGADAVTLETWVKNDARAQKVMVNSCGAKVLIHVCNCDSAKEIWDKLNSVYEQSNKASKHLLQEQFYAYKKDSTHDIATHISTLEGMVHKLKVTGVTIEESMLITKILMTLPPQYQHFSSAWDSTAADQQTLINLTNRLMIEESRFGIQNVNLNEVAKSEAMMAKGAVPKQQQSQGDKKKSQKRKKQRGKCFNCGSTKHYRDQCTVKTSKENDKSNTKDEKKDEKKCDKGFLGTTSILAKLLLVYGFWCYQPYV